MNLFLVFEWKAGRLEFTGVFETQAAADAICTTNQMCVCPATLNESCAGADGYWPNAYYPKAIKQTAK